MTKHIGLYEDDREVSRGGRLDYARTGKFNRSPLFYFSMINLILLLLPALCTVQRITHSHRGLPMLRALISHISTPISTPFSRRLRRSWRPKHGMLRRLVVRPSGRGRVRPPRVLHTPRALTRWGSGAGAMARAVMCARLARKRRRTTPGRKMAGKAPPTMACARPATLGASVRGSEASVDKYSASANCGALYAPVARPVAVCTGYQRHWYLPFKRRGRARAHAPFCVATYIICTNKLVRQVGATSWYSIKRHSLQRALELAHLPGAYQGQGCRQG